MQFYAGHLRQNVKNKSRSWRCDSAENIMAMHEHELKEKCNAVRSGNKICIKNWNGSLTLIFYRCMFTAEAHSTDERAESCRAKNKVERVECTYVTCERLWFGILTNEPQFNVDDACSVVRMNTYDTLHGNSARVKKICLLFCGFIECE